jgi:hypothetical protein
MTQRKPLGLPLGLPLSEPQGLPLGKPLGLGVPYSLLLTPNSYLPSPTWLPTLYLTRVDTTGQAHEIPGDQP